MLAGRACENCFVPITDVPAPGERHDREQAEIDALVADTSRHLRRIAESEALMERIASQLQSTDQRCFAAQSAIDASRTRIVATALLLYRATTSA